MNKATLLFAALLLNFRSALAETPKAGAPTTPVEKAAVEAAKRHGGEGAGAGGTCPESGPSEGEIKQAAESAITELQTGPIIPESVRRFLEQHPNGLRSEFYKVEPLKYGAYLREEVHGEYLLRDRSLFPDRRGLIDLLLREPAWSKKLSPETIRKLNRAKGNKLSEIQQELFDSVTENLTPTEKLNLAQHLDEMHFTEAYSAHVLSTMKPRTHALLQLYQHQILDSALVKKIVAWLKQMGLNKDSTPQTGEGKTAIRKIQVEELESIRSILDEYRSYDQKYLGKTACYSTIYSVPFPLKYRNRGALKMAMDEAFKQFGTTLSETMQNAIIDAYYKAFSKGPARAKPSEEKPENAPAQADK